MFCPNCGTRHEDWVRFCPDCGASMDVVIHPPVEKSVPAAVEESQPIVEETPTSQETPTAEEVAVENCQTVDPAQSYTPVLETIAPAPQAQPPVVQMPLATEETQPAQEDVPLKHPVPMGEKPVSLGKWLALLAVEMLCSLAHIVLLFVWAFSKNSEKSMQNYARAKLIVIGASVVLAVLLIVVFSVVILKGDGDISTQLRWYFFH